MAALGLSVDFVDVGLVMTRKSLAHRSLTISCNIDAEFVILTRGKEENCKGIVARERKCLDKYEVLHSLPIFQDIFVDTGSAVLLQYTGGKRGVSMFYCAMVKK